MPSASARNLPLLLCGLIWSGASFPSPAEAPVARAPSPFRRDDTSVHQAQVEARILSAPHIFPGSDGRRHLAYELRITSFQSDDDPISLVRVTIFSGNDPVPLTTIEGASIYSLLSQPAGESDPRDGVLIPSGRSKTLFLWLTLPFGVQPDFLRHQLVFRTQAGATQYADDIRTPVVEGAPLRIASPLSGGRWLAAEGPGNHLSHHWGGMVAINGKLTIPQRFAIDWFGLDNDNHAFRGANASPASTKDEDWIGYGQNVLAVADGEVADARDGEPNGKPLAPQDVPDDLTARTLYGNFVVLKIASGVYAHYAHLQAGSLTVKIGQHVRRGAVIGRLGQTGAAGAPHLHFHISDRPTFEQSDGLPFEIESFTLLGRGKIDDMLDPTRPIDLSSPSASAHHFEMPLDGDVVAFP